MIEFEEDPLKKNLPYKVMEPSLRLASGQVPIAMIGKSESCWAGFAQLLPLLSQLGFISNRRAAHGQI